jgi:ribose transport system substrate-binding protein
MSVVPGKLRALGDRRWRAAVLSVCFVVLSAIFVAACGGGSDSTGGNEETSTAGEGKTSSGGGESDVTLAFSHPYAEAPLVQLINEEVKGNGEAKGWKVLLDQTKAGNLQEQTATVENWITQGVTAISIYAPEPKSFEVLAKRATDAGIIWTTYGNEMKEGAGGVTFPASISGKITGEAAVKWINENDPDAEVLVLNAASAPPLADRTDIPIEMIEEETDATIVANQEAIEQAVGLQVTESLLQAHPNASVVIGVSDDGALGAADAFGRDSDKKPSEVFIIGQDGSEEALKALEDPNSYFRASAALNLKELTQEVVDLTGRAIDKGWEPGDEQEYVPLSPTLIENGQTSLIEKFLATFQAAG